MTDCRCLLSYYLIFQDLGETFVFIIVFGTDRSMLSGFHSRKHFKGKIINRSVKSARILQMGSTSTDFDLRKLGLIILYNLIG